MEHQLRTSLFMCNGFFTIQVMGVFVIEKQVNQCGIFLIVKDAIKNVS